MLNFTENRHRISEKKSHKELFIGTIHLETRQDKRDTETRTAHKISITAKHSPPSLLFTKRLRTTSNPRCLSTQQKSIHASLSTQIAASDTKKSERPNTDLSLDFHTCIFSIPNRLHANFGKCTDTGSVRWGLYHHHSYTPECRHPSRHYPPT